MGIPDSPDARASTEERAAALAQEFDRWLMMRDTTRRQTARFNVPRAGGARAHPDYARARARRF